MAFFGENFDDPKTMGLMQLAAGLMAAGGPSEKPVNFGMGLLGGLDKYQTVMDAAKKMKMAEDELGLKKDMFGLSKQELDLKAQAAQRKLAVESFLMNKLGGAAPVKAVPDLSPTNRNAALLDAGLPPVMKAETPQTSRGGIESLTPSDIAMFKVLGIDIADIYKLATEPKVRKPGDVVESADGSTSRQVMNDPSYLRQVVGQEGAIAKAKAAAEAEYTPPRVDLLGMDGRPVQGASYADQRRNLGGQSLPSASVVPGSVNAFSGLSTPQDVQRVASQQNAILASPTTTPEQKQTAKNTLEQLRFVQQDMAKQSPVQLSGPADIKAREAINTQFIDKRLPEIVAAGDAANSRIDQVKMARNALAGVKGEGWGTDIKATMANVLVGLGLDTQNAKMFATKSQQFNSVASERLWTVLNAAKGPQTEGDAQRANNTFAKLTNTKEANAFILDMMQAIAERDVIRARFFNGAMPTAQATGNYGQIETEWQQRMPSVFSMPTMQRWAQ